MAANDAAGGPVSRRLDIRLGYSLGVLSGRFTATPELGLGFSDTGRDYSAVWRMSLNAAGNGSLTISLEAGRQEYANDNADPAQSLGLRLSASF